MKFACLNELVFPSHLFLLLDLVKHLLKGFRLLLSFDISDDVYDLEILLAQPGSVWGDVGELDSETFISLFKIRSFEDVDTDGLDDFS